MTARRALGSLSGGCFLIGFLLGFWAIGLLGPSSGVVAAFAGPSWRTPGHPTSSRLPPLRRARAATDGPSVMGRRYLLTGYTTCSFHERAAAAARGLQREGALQAEVEEGARPWYFRRLGDLRALFPSNPRARGWGTSPFIYWEDGDAREFVGGCDDFMELMAAAHPKSAAVKAALAMEVWRDGQWTT